MTKEEAILRYRAAMAVISELLTGGLLTIDELRTIETVLAQKYELSFRSIYRERNLQCGEMRGIYGGGKGGSHE